MHKSSTFVSKRLFPFLAVAFVVGFAVLGQGCSGGGSDKALNDYKPEFSFSHDENSLRFEDEQLVLDLVLSNRSEYDLQDVDLTVAVDNGTADKFQKQLKAPTWRRGEERRVAVPVLNNDLDAYHQPSRSGNKFDIAGSAYIQTDGKSRKKVDVGNQPPEWARTPNSGTSAEAWRPWEHSFQPVGVGEGQLNLSKSNKLPALKNVKLLVVGYTGDDNNKKEQFKKLYSLDSVGNEKVSLSIPATHFTEIRVRGLGHRVVAGAKDVGEEKKVFYICDNYPIVWK